MVSTFSILTGLVMAVLIGSFPALGMGHPFHTSHSEMEWNAVKGRYEVSLRVLASDLQQALALRARPLGRETTNLQDSPESEPQICAYLEDHISLSSHSALAPPPASQPRSRQRPDLSDRSASQSSLSHSRLTWIGKEQEGSWVWLHFELDMADGSAAVEISNTLFFEINSGQVNLCTLRSGKRKTSLRTDAQHPAVLLPPQVRAP